MKIREEGLYQKTLKTSKEKRKAAKPDWWIKTLRVPSLPGLPGLYISLAKL